MSYGIPLGQAAGILAAIYAEGAVYQAPWVQNHTLEDGGATMQGGRSCAGAQMAPAEKFGLGRKF